MRCLVCTKAVNQYSKSNDEKCGCIENILHKVLLRGVDKKPYENSDSSHKKERAAYKEYTVSVRARVWIIVFGHGRYKLNNYYVKLTPVNAKSFLAQSSISVCREGLLLGYLLLGFLCGGFPSGFCPCPAESLLTASFVACFLGLSLFFRGGFILLSEALSGLP